MRVLLIATAILALGAQSAFAVNTDQINGNPLKIWIGENGSFQDQVLGNTDYSFYPPADPNGNAGLVLAFPTSQPAGVFAVPQIQGKVWGWTSDGSGPPFDSTFTAVGSQTLTGSGTEGDPYTETTTYRVVVLGTPRLEVKQTTTYVNGDSIFVMKYEITNLTSGISASSVKFRTLVVADVYLNESDCGFGIFKTGPRFVGGTSLGRVGGFTEAPSPAPQWDRYFEGQVQGGFATACQTAPDQPDSLWDYVDHAADDGSAGFPSTVNTSDLLDNGIGVQWDTNYNVALGAGETATFQFNTLGTIPGVLTLTPSSQSVTAGAQAGLTAAATDGSGGPAAGASVRFSVSGANSTSGAVTADGNGQAGISYTPTRAGTDTLTAFHDIDGNGVQGQAEPSATATVTVTSTATQSDKTPPRLRIIVRRSVKLKALLRGLVTAANSSEPASLRFELLGPAKPRAKTFTRKLARKSLPFGKGGTRAVVLKPKKKKLVKAKKFKLRVRVTATDKAGNRTVATKLVRVK